VARFQKREVVTTEVPAMNDRDGRSAASIQFACPSCEEECHTAILGDSIPRACPSCDWTFSAPGMPPNENDPIGACWVCGNEEFFIQKDFNRQLGFFIVATSFTIIFLVMLLAGHRWGIYCLFGLAAVDYVAYRLLRNVTVCYLCNTIYRRFPLHPGHKGFYLGTEEKHKHLRQEWLSSLTENGDSESRSARDAKTDVVDAAEKP
jgi:hypothetical protein